jgi:hypothetical protein
MVPDHVFAEGDARATSYIRENLVRQLAAFIVDQRLLDGAGNIDMEYIPGMNATRLTVRCYFLPGNAFHRPSKYVGEAMASPSPWPSKYA